MKKLLGFGLIVTLLLASCAKEKGRQQDKDTNYHFTYKVNGTSKSYTGFIAAHLDTTNGFIELKVIGNVSVTSQNDYLGFYLSNDDGKGSIATGQYLDTQTNYTLLSTFAYNGVEYEAGQTMVLEAAANNVTITNHFKVNITAMDKTSIRGTFGGDYYGNGDVENGAKLSITEGDFYVKFL